MADREDESASTRRDVGIWGASFLALNGMIGAAIFGLPGILDSHVGSFAPWLLLIAGVDPVSAAVFLTAFSHVGRVRSEAAFACLAGAAPIPASSGNTNRHRLNRHGDRRLNSALDTVARVRLSYDPDTRAYKQRRLAEGKTTREIRRMLKRYIARQIYRHLTATSTGSDHWQDGRGNSTVSSATSTTASSGMSG